jgi:hypothetical protein
VRDRIIQLCIGVLLVLIGPNALTQEKSACKAARTTIERFTIHASSCPARNGNHKVIVSFRHRAKTIEEYSFIAEGGPMYELRIERIKQSLQPSIELIGVSNGKGRTHDGANYFLLNTQSAKTSNPGDLPPLTSATSPIGALYALVPSSGRYTATRLDYKIDAMNLILLRQIQFMNNDQGFFLVIRVKTATTGGEGDGNELAKPAEFAVSEAVSLSCMRGGVCE